jgi:hypothetical protein
MDAVFRIFPAWPSIEKSPDAPLKNLIIISSRIAYCAAVTYNSLDAFRPGAGLSFGFHEA